MKKSVDISRGIYQVRLSTPHGITDGGMSHGIPRGRFSMETLLNVPWVSLGHSIQIYILNIIITEIVNGKPW